MCSHPLVFVAAYYNNLLKMTGKGEEWGDSGYVFKMLNPILAVIVTLDETDFLHNKEV